MSTSSSADLRDFAEVSEHILDRNPQARAEWDKIQPAVELALMLVRLRKSRGLSQAEVAARGGWDKGFVSRLERPDDRLPDLRTIMRYLEACGARGGIVVTTDEEAERAHVEDAVSLSGGEAYRQVFEGMRDRDIDWTEEGAGVR